MLPKHSRDIVYIMVILVLIGMLVGLSKDVWIIIAINILIISTGLIYVKLSEIEEKVNVTLKNAYSGKENGKTETNPYVTLYELAKYEKEDCDNDADYGNFDAVRDSHLVITKFLSGEINEKKFLADISHICKTKLLIYYLGLEAILKADVYRLNDLDKQYIATGVKLLRASNFEKRTSTLDFINKSKLL